MKKAKKPKARKTALDRIVAQLRTVLRRETPDVVSAGNLLIESRKHLEHGEWQDWLAENFDLSLRSAQNPVAAAEYAARVKSKSANVADFSNLALTVLYALAAGHYNEQEEAAILAATRKGRVDQTRAAAIREALAPPGRRRRSAEPAAGASTEEVGNCLQRRSHCKHFRPPRRQQPRLCVTPPARATPGHPWARPGRRTQPARWHDPGRFQEAAGQARCLKPIRCIAVT
jgi:hypothetical protein